MRLMDSHPIAIINDAKYSFADYNFRVRGQIRKNRENFDLQNFLAIRYRYICVKENYVFDCVGILELLNIHTTCISVPLKWTTLALCLLLHVSNALMLRLLCISYGACWMRLGEYFRIIWP